MFDDLSRAKKRLTSFYSNGKAESKAGKYGRMDISTQGDPGAEVDVIIPSRTLPPTKPFVFGASKYPLGHAPGPFTIQSKPVQDYGRHRPVWRGWRPGRPVDSYADLGSEMPVSSRNYKIEVDVPGEGEILGMSERNAQMPYPTVPEGEEIPDIYREYNMFHQQKRSTLADFGAVSPESVTSLAKEIASGITARYGSKVEEYKLKQAALQSGQTAAPSIFQKSAVPIGTVALLGAAALAAVFVLPKILR